MCRFCVLCFEQEGVDCTELTPFFNAVPPQIERRMELVRLVSHSTHKRLAACLQGQLGTEAEKRHVSRPYLSARLQHTPQRPDLHVKLEAVLTW